MSVYDDLDEFMVGDEADLEPLTTDEQVERMVRAVAHRRRKITQAEALVTAERERLDEWLAEQHRRYDPAYLVDCLRNYHEARLQDDPKARTIHVPSGSLTARAGQPRWDIDLEAFIPWALTNATDLLRVKHEPDRAAIKATLAVDDRGVAVDGAGVIVPGVHVDPPVVAFHVKTEADE